MTRRAWGRGLILGAFLAEAAAGACASLALAAPGPAVEVKPARARPGDVVLVRVNDRTGAGAAQPRVKVEGRTGDPVATWPTRRGHEAVVPLPRDRGPGPLVMAVIGAGLAGASNEDPPGLTVEVRERPRKEVQLQVEARFVDPPAEARQRIEADGVAIKKAYASSSPSLDVRRPFRWPRPEVAITSRFGEQRTFNGTLQSEHEGTDLRASEGQSVRAANQGRVVLSRDCFHSGNTVILDHGGRVFTAYFHLSELQVKEGEQVRHGQTVGLVGNTGRSTAAHLHFAVHVAGEYVDPESFMRLRLDRPRAPGHASR